MCPEENVTNSTSPPSFQKMCVKRAGVEKYSFSFFKEWPSQRVISSLLVDC